MRHLLWISALTGCHPYAQQGPLGLPLATDGVVRAGASTVDITPDIPETYTDLNGNFTFDGCLDDPTGTKPGCAEPFVDANGNGHFDAVFMGGFGPMRPANGVHDPISVRAVVLVENGQYIAFVGIDTVGFGSPHIHAARDRLMSEGFDPDRLLVAAMHNHQAPDTMGLWGDPYDIAAPVSGVIPAYQLRIEDAIVSAVTEAARRVEPVTLRVGAVKMRDLSPFYNGALFGGKNPTATMHGMVHDIRDPVVVSDQLLVLQGKKDDGTAVFTFTNWSGHPETRGGDNDQISADWIGPARDALEAHYGGIALHMPECLGGMQSALGGDVPLVDVDGTHEFQTCDADAIADASDSECFGKAVGTVRVDGDGDPVPQWATHESWEFVTSHGWAIAEGAENALDNGEDVDATPIRVAAADLYVPIENVAYKLLAPSGIFDLGLQDAVTDPSLCPESTTENTGCIPTRTFRAQVGPVTYVAVPGEMLPEVAWGFPSDDPEWTKEAADPTARGPGATYFPQHDPDCNTVAAYSDCTNKEAIGTCDCLSLHDWPYVISPDPSQVPLLDPVDTKYKAILGMTDNYLSYIIPEPDFNTWVSLLQSNDGDHYEDTVSPAHNFATRVQEAQDQIDANWKE